MNSPIHHAPLFPIGLGAMPLSLSRNFTEQESIEIVETFIEHGGNFIDTANVYAVNSLEKGHNERLLHKALHRLNAKDHILIATKGGATRPNDGWALGGGKPKELREACEESLKNIGIDAHSLYYLHGPDPDVPLTDSFGELARLRDEGKIIHLGIANVNLAQLELASEIAPIASVQNRCNVFCKADLHNGLMDYCQRHHIIYASYHPFCGWADHNKYTRLQCFAALTDKYQTSSYLICLAWLLAQSKHILPIPGMDKKEHIPINFQALQLRLDVEDMEYIAQFPDYFVPCHVES